MRYCNEELLGIRYGEAFSYGLTCMDSLSRRLSSTKLSARRRPKRYGVRKNKCSGWLSTKTSQESAEPEPEPEPRSSRDGPSACEIVSMRLDERSWNAVAQEIAVIETLLEERHGGNESNEP